MINSFLKSLERAVYWYARSYAPKLHVVLDYQRAHGRWPRLNPPITFNEKICWRKLYDHDPRLPDLVDKIKVKEIIAAKYGADLIIPTLAVYDCPDHMDFGKAPLNKPPYVLKGNHGCDMNLFVKDHAFDPAAIRKQLHAFLRHDHAAVLGEWAYSRVKRRILCECFIEMPEGYLTDYKFHVFDGKVFAIERIIGRFKEPYNNVYDRGWNLFSDLYYGFPAYKGEMPPPVRLGEMIDLAEKIGREFAYVRVDLYEVDQAIKFGELTFYPGAGLDPFTPIEWDEKFGAQWNQDWNRRR